MSTKQLVGTFTFQSSMHTSFADTASEQWPGSKLALVPVQSQVSSKTGDAVRESNQTGWFVMQDKGPAVVKDTLSGQGQA